MKPKDLEIACPIYGFVVVKAEERKVVESDEFQRLRRIRQLGWTDAVFPGAMHTRFEHSLGVMHMVTQLFDSLRSRHAREIRDWLELSEGELEHWRQCIRYTALFHDIGHGPFSHVAEEVTPDDPETGKPFKHEAYSLAALRRRFPELLQEFPAIIELIDKSPKSRAAKFFKKLIDGQIDGDRMDYLMRDAHHTGVPYGRYDWQRLVATLTVFPAEGDEPPHIGLTPGGRHAAESLIVARYMMFNNVYGHRARLVTDFHLAEAMRGILPGGRLPPPDDEHIEAYLGWDDWKVLGALAERRGGEHADRLRKRLYFKQVWATPELASAEDKLLFDRVQEQLKDLEPVRKGAPTYWYKLGYDEEIMIGSENDPSRPVPLSKCSNIVGGLQASERLRLFVDRDYVAEAMTRLNSFPLKVREVAEASAAEDTP